MFGGLVLLMIDNVLARRSVQYVVWMLVYVGTGVRGAGVCGAGVCGADVYGCWYV